MTLISTARGKVFSLDATFEALKSGRLRAFAAHVLESEPPDPRHPLIVAFKNRELQFDGRILFTPHAAHLKQPRTPVS